MMKLNSLDCNQRYPLYGYILGICILFATSSFAHLMNCAWSRCWRNVCFVLDYAAISVFGVSSAIVYQYLVRLDDGSCSYRFLGAVTLSAVVAMWICCWSRLNAHPLSHVIRTLAFGLPSVFGSMPAFYRYLNSYSNATAALEFPTAQSNTTYNDMLDLTTGMADVTSSADVMTSSDPDLFYQDRYPRHFVMLIGGAAIKALKVPERWRPGVFDIVGHSHQLFHVFIFLGIREQFWLLLEDIFHTSSQRRLSNTLPTFAPAVMTFVIMACLLAAIGLIINWFAQSLTEQHHITTQEEKWFERLQKEHFPQQQPEHQQHNCHHQQNGHSTANTHEKPVTTNNEHHCFHSKEHGD